MGQYLFMVNRQMMLLSQLKEMARSRAERERIVRVLRVLRAQRAQMRLRGNKVPYPELDAECEMMVAQAQKKNQPTEYFYRDCSALSKKALEHLEQCILEAPEERMEISSLVQETRSDVRELMDWVVLLAGGQPTT